jgi:hypothetical protein
VTIKYLRHGTDATPPAPLPSRAASQQFSNEGS